MAIARVIIQDEVNVQLRGVDRGTLGKIVEAQSYYVPKYMFSPKYKLGQWNGKISLAKASGRVFLNLLDEVAQILENSGYNLDIEDQRQDYPITLSQFDENYLSEYSIKNTPVVIRDYQIDAIKTAIEHGNGILTVGTGGGKTLICAVISKLYLEHGLVLVIVPNIDLVFQTTATFRNFGVDCGMWYGELKEMKPCVISTWQSLENTPELFHDVITVVVDECLAGDTMITTPAGPVRIDKLREDDVVLSYNTENGNVESDRIVKVHNNLTKSSNEKMYELVFDDGTILEMTGNHKVWTSRGYVRADELMPEDEVINLNTLDPRYQEENSNEEEQ
jgi:hypothetical protein